MSRIATSPPRFGRAAATFALTVLAVAVSLSAGRQTVNAADRTAVLILPASGRNVSGAFPWHARTTLVQRLGQAPGLEVIDLDRPPTDQPPPPVMAAGLARAFKASVALSLDIAHENGQTTLTVACVDAVQARVTCSFRETSPADPRVIPLLTQRLADSVLASLHGAQAEDTAGLVETARPSMPRRWSVGLQATVLLPVASARPTSYALSGWDLALALDEGDLRIDLSAEYAGDSVQQILGVGLGMFRPLRGDRLIPYLGGRAFWISQQLGGRGARGAQLRPTVGVLWGRAGSLRLHLEAGYFVSLFEEREVDRLFAGSGRGHVAHGVLLSLGVSL